MGIDKIPVLDQIHDEIKSSPQFSVLDAIQDLVV